MIFNTEKKYLFIPKTKGERYKHLSSKLSALWKLIPHIRSASMATILFKGIAARSLTTRVSFPALKSNQTLIFFFFFLQLRFFFYLLPVYNHKVPCFFHFSVMGILCFLHFPLIISHLAILIYQIEMGRWIILVWIWILKLFCYRMRSISYYFSNHEILRSFLGPVWMNGLIYSF